ncbi:hypothetical protein HanXRQr2_Chr15g0682511 [Helianthus annuus]|uniref:Molybdenum cofactor sulfurase middle domain-containing protein n=1 Tax=Helianthus annuus TaxID=4232 RepID=A0A9K3DY47_HELAN|nr:hypothetical protein HanXRQr2_Chr15g0682511 [Helianthus annuus]
MSADQKKAAIDIFQLCFENRAWKSMVRAPGMAELKVSLAKPGLRSDGVSVWEWSGSALDEGDETAKWFTDFLGKPSCLVRFNEGTHYQSEDAAIGSQPRKTMMKFRSAEALELNTTTTKYKGQPYLGQMLVCEDKTNKGKIVSVGDIMRWKRWQIRPFMLPPVIIVLKWLSFF